MKEFRKYNLANTISAQRSVPYIISKSILTNRLPSNKAIYIYGYRLTRYIRAIYGYKLKLHLSSWMG